MALYGLGAFLAASEAGYTALRWAGAVYLIYLGARLILNARAGFSEIEPADANTQHSATQHGTAHSSANWFLRGFLTNMLNPKVGAFYVAFLPQFIPASIQPGADLVTFSVLLAGIHAVEGIAWFALLISATQPLMSLLRRPTVLRTLDRVTGGVLIAFGLKLLWDVRRV